MKELHWSDPFQKSLGKLQAILVKQGSLVEVEGNHRNLAAW